MIELERIKEMLLNIITTKRLDPERIIINPASYINIYDDSSKSCQYSVFGMKIIRSKLLPIGEFAICMNEQDMVDTLYELSIMSIPTFYEKK